MAIAKNKESHFSIFHSPILSFHISGGVELRPIWMVKWVPTDKDQFDFSYSTSEFLYYLVLQLSNKVILPIDDQILPQQTDLDLKGGTLTSLFHLT